MNSLNIIKEKITERIEDVVARWRGNSESIVFTNGCFDILHRGHIEYLSGAADKADRFVVGINTDDSVRALDKGRIRPIQDENSRALIIAALDFVDAVVLFNEDTPYELISRIKPDVLVKGGDYDAHETDSNSPNYIVGSDVVKKHGGKVDVIQFVPGYSTTSIEQKIKNS